MSDFELPRDAKQQNKKPTPQKDSPSLNKADLGVEEAQENEEKEQPKYSQEELLKIFDDIIFSGEYSETVKIKNKLQFTFRTRTAEEIDEIQKFIDAAGMNLISSVETARSVMNLQYALVDYQKHSLGTMKFEERAKFVKRLPGPVVGVLIGELNKFDQKVAAAFAEGEKNF